MRNTSNLLVVNNLICVLFNNANVGGVQCCVHQKYSVIYSLQEYTN